ncbi:MULTISPECIES: type II toxin-antitoxin system VapC family toxin [unclassified Nostoc]|uniref:type II toxin-antitoxin system VapC family toxin n=2 Tax=Nostoc TaxID=1177 RepID=UPI000B95BEC1|nr:PIN domain-containing protein [Nostoc sp. 'Peltigera membranacea cyanobiont' 232]OYE04967.1 pilus assembly protein [Nostoc sp. 'Peltigera membranacea cyanobiont' 232]
MKQNIIIDTGPLVALINNREQYHSWATQEVANLAYPFFTCEAVISEACFILRDFYGGEDAVMSLLNTGLIQISFRLSDEIGTVRELMKRYQNVPMSLADACLVRMSELISGSTVLTLDSDFRVYRKNKNEMMDLIIADGI